ncbi:MAG: response regulator [Desulfobacterales bacterium]|nr:response regulator [Desulfobacterales bacterium]
MRVAAVAQHADPAAPALVVTSLLFSVCLCPVMDIGYTAAQVASGQGSGFRDPAKTGFTIRQLLLVRTNRASDVQAPATAFFLNARTIEPEQSPLVFGDSIGCTCERSLTGLQPPSSSAIRQGAEPSRGAANRAKVSAPPADTSHGGEGRHRSAPRSMSFPGGSIRLSIRSSETDSVVADTEKLEHLLIIDDEESILGVVGEYFRRRGYQVLTAGNGGPRPWRSCTEREVDCCFTDINMPEMNGLELAERIQPADNTLPVIVMTGYPSLDNSIRTLKNGVVDFLIKPVNLKHMELSLRRVMRQRALFVENVLLKQEVKGKERLETLNRELLSQDRRARTP